MAKTDVEDAEVLERNVNEEAAAVKEAEQLEKEAADKAAAEKAAAEESASQKTTSKKKPTDQKKSPGKNSVPTPKSGGGEDTHEGVAIDWGDNSDFISQVTAAPTKESTAEAARPHEELSDEPTAAEKKEFLESDFNADEEGLSEEDLFITAELVIEMFDGFNSIGVGAFAKEPSHKFELESSKKKTLTALLAKVFYRYQAKMGPVAALVIAALLYFGMTWKMGYDIRKEKKEDAAKAAIQAKKEKQRKRKEGFRNQILAAVDIESITLKEMGKRMNIDPPKLKDHVKTLCEQGLLFADHSKPIIHYRQAA